MMVWRQNMNTQGVWAAYPSRDVHGNEGNENWDLQLHRLLRLKAESVEVQAEMEFLVSFLAVSLYDFFLHWRLLRYLYDTARKHDRLTISTSTVMAVARFVDGIKCWLPRAIAHEWKGSNATKERSATTSL
jgi:hypothetical protein